MKRVYVGNLSPETSEEDLRRLFGEHGDVLTVDLATGQGTSRRLGFGYVEMEGADAAIAALHNIFLAGRYLTVHEARPRGFRSVGPSRW